MKVLKAPLLIIFLLLVFVGFWSFTYTVNERETAIKLQLGEVVKTIYEPGLYFKIPFWNNVLVFDRRNQTQDSRPQEFLTNESKFVVVDSFIKWRIEDVGQFYRSTRGNMRRAGDLLAERINTALRDEFAKRTIREVVSGERTEIMQQISIKANDDAQDLGVKIVDVRIKQINFPKTLSEAIYRRMSTKREQFAKELRAQGEKEAARIRAEAARERTEIVANAYRDSEKLRGLGDATAADIYSTAFKADDEFYAFWRSLKSYRKVFEQGGDLMVLQPDSEFFRFLNQRQEGVE